MAETRASKSKGRKLDSIISKLKILPSQEAMDTQNELLNTLQEKKDSEAKESDKSNDVERRRSKRKSQKIVRYRIDDGSDNDITESQVEGISNQVENEVYDKDSQLPETIFEELPNGDTATFDTGEDTTVLFLPAEEIQVRTGPSDDYLGDLLDGGQDSHQEEEKEEETSKEKKKKKKKKTYESDESLDEDGLPRRVVCTACGRKINPSHGTILRHPVLNVLVCKKCNQYYNSGPFTRDEYGIEEQCRWCGDGGDLICCDHCEKVYCKPCIQRNCGKTYLKNLLNAPEDFKWFCIACQKDKPIKHIQRLRKKCEEVMQVLENLKAKKAHFKSKKGQQASVVSGPTTSERRNRLNCLSEGIKAEEVSSSGESPTKKTFGKDADLPPELFSKIVDETQEDSDKEKDADIENDDENRNTKAMEDKQDDDKEEEDVLDTDSQTRSLRSRSKDKKSGDDEPKDPIETTTDKIEEKQDSNKEDGEDSESHSRRRSLRSCSKEKKREDNNAEEAVEATADKTEEEKEGNDKDEGDEINESQSRRRSLRSRINDKKSESEEHEKPLEAATEKLEEEEKQEHEETVQNEEEMDNIIEEQSEQPEKRKTRSQQREQIKKEQETAENITKAKENADNKPSEETDNASKKNKENSKMTQDEEPIDKESNESADNKPSEETDSASKKNEENSKKTQDEEPIDKESLQEDEEETEREEVRVTRSGIKRIENIKARRGSKGTPQQSDEEESLSNKTKAKVKTILDKLKDENLSDELDSSDSASGKRPSRKSKDRANRLMIKTENKKKTPQPKSIVVLDSSDDNKEQEKVSEEQSKEKKNSEKIKVFEMLKDRKQELKSVKSEKSASDSSNSKISRSRKKGNDTLSESKRKSKKDSSRGSDSDSTDSDDNLNSIKSKLKSKKESDLSSDSDFQTKNVSKNKPTKKKQNNEKSSDSDSVDASNSFKLEYSLEESSDENSSDSSIESDDSPKTNRSRGLQKQTRKRPRPVASSSDSQESSEDSSEDEGVARRTRKRKQIESESSDETAKTSKSMQNKRQKKTIKKGRKVRQRKTALDSESEASVHEESSDSEPDGKTKSKKSKQRKKQKGKKPAKKQKRRRVKNKSDDESTDDDKEEKSPSKGRRKIRKILTDDKLGEETQKARRLEEERRKRLLERTRTAEDDEIPRESWNLNTVVLEKDKETKEPLVEVHSDLVQHLKPHQAKGIQFMYNNIIDCIEAYKKGDKGGGCILAHCMGLGKTLQVVSLIHTLHNHDDFEFNTILVIAPLNTVLNWQVEFDKWLNVDERMDVFVLKEAGHNNWHRADMLKQWQRYGGIMIVGYDAYRNLSLCKRVRSKHQKKIFMESLVDPGPDLVVCDEGHILRNDQSAISKAVNSIKTRRRIVLTGTPLQNNLIEYHCMVSFVKPNLLGTRKEFMNIFGNPIMNGQCVDSSPLDVRIMKQTCHVLYKLLEACVQRRDYSVLTPFLPPKHEYVVKIRLSEVQRKLYSHYLNTFVFPEGTLQGSFTGRGASLFSDYQALMRIWTHPWCLKLEAIRRSLRAPYSDSDNSLDGFVVHTDEEEESEAECSSDALSLKSDDSLPKKKNGEVFQLKSSSDEESGNNNTSDEEIMPQPSKRMTRSNGPVKVDDDKQQNGSGDGESNTRSGNTFKEEVPEDKEWYDEFLTPEDEYNVELSGKLALVLEILADAEAVEEKVLVFSQSLVTLDLIERALGGGEVGGDRENWCRGCDYFRLDGSTSVHLRQRWADIFNDTDNKTARLFLISTKAGGLGINLVAANRVVVFDVSWNPSHDVQSIFRVYRFGQTKPVYVYRLVSEGAMEERIYDRQIAKLSTSQRVIDKHQIERHFTAADLAELYRFNPSVYNEDTNSDDVPSLPLPKDAVLADLINRMHPKWIVKYHEHDSLLQNKTEEQLTEEECKQAWAAYEAQKNQAKQQFDARSLQAQYAQQQLAQQRQAVPSQNMNFSNAVLQQVQHFQRQQLSERMARMQADAAMQGRHYLPPGHNMHNQQLQQHQLLQHLGATRPVYPPRPGAPYQPMMTYMSQQQQQAHRMVPPRLPTTPQHPQANPSQTNTIVLRHGAPPTYSRM